MATSGTTDFDLDMTEVIEEAFERAGLEARTGYHFRTARRSLDLMMIDWANRGLNLWQIDEQSQALTASTAQYALADGTVDVIEHMIRTGSGSSQADYNLNRISVSRWANLTNKNTEGRPTEVWFDKQTGETIEANLWPIPDASTYTLVYWRLRRIEDTGTDGANTMDIRHHFLPALVSGLAYNIAMKTTGVEIRVPHLKAQYEEDFDLASQRDRETASLRLVPRIAHV